MADKQYDDTNRGALFKNDKTDGNPNWPDYKGRINVDGKDYWLSAWLKDGKKGKFMSLSVQPKDAKPSAKKAETEQQPEFDDDIPF